MSTSGLLIRNEYYIILGSDRPFIMETGRLISRWDYCKKVNPANEYCITSKEVINVVSVSSYILGKLK